MDGGSPIARHYRKTADFLQRVFRERQIYVRSEGDIRYIVLSPATQITACVSGIALLGWLAFATVNVAFKDQIIALKEKRIAEVKHAYEARISEIRASVDKVNSRLLLDQDSYLAKVDDLRADYEKLIERQKTLETFLQQGNSGIAPEETADDVSEEEVQTEQAEGAIEADAAEPAMDADMTADPDTATAAGESPALSGDEETIARDDNDPSRGGPPALKGALDGDQDADPAQPAGPDEAKEAQPEDKSDITSSSKTTAAHRDRHGVVIPRAKPLRPAVVNASLTDLAPPVLGSLRARYSTEFRTADEVLMPIQDIKRLAQHVDQRQHATLNQVEERIATRLAGLKQTTKNLGLAPDRLIRSAPPRTALGGPFIPVSQPGTDDPLLVRISKIEDLRDDSHALAMQLRRLPLDVPIKEARINSGFGTRRDPFRRSRAMHTGIDLKASYGAPVRATAPGVVTEAQWSSGYGKLVVIDHDNGVSTRYAHLSVISVKPGQRVAKGSIVGRLGNTGRSTGAHLHYETRVNGRAVDPKRFWQARNDLQEQEQATGSRP
jgi:murein DD-endopeptidase MepM/ murein hydrolase activator NlpD